MLTLSATSHSILERGQPWGWGRGRQGAVDREEAQKTVGIKGDRERGGVAEVGGGECLFSSLRASQGSRVWLEQLLLRVLVLITY